MLHGVFWPVLLSDGLGQHLDLHMTRELCALDHSSWMFETFLGRFMTHVIVPGDNIHINGTCALDAKNRDSSLIACDST